MIAAITGANGFIGGHLVRRFVAAGWQTRPIVRRDLESNALTDVLRGADVVIHAAGATRAPTVRELRESNVELTRRTMNAARDGGVARLIFISSQAAAGPALSLTSPTLESDVPRPFEAYGRTKLEAEEIVRRCTEMDVAIVRPAAVYGAGDRDFLPMFRLARRGIALHPSNRDAWISLIHVDDLADGVLRCAASDAAKGQTYFLANDEPVQWANLFRLGAECAQRALRLDVDVPRGIVAAGARIGDLLAIVTGRAGLLTTRKVALSIPRFWVCSAEKARRDLSFGGQIELRRGLSDTFAWYRAHQWV